MRYLPSARERTQVVHAWLNQLLVERMALEPGVDAKNDMSMRSRITAYLSDAMLAFEQCKCALPSTSSCTPRNVEQGKQPLKLQSAESPDRKGTAERRCVGTYRRISMQ